MKNNKLIAALMLLGASSALPSMAQYTTVTDEVVEYSTDKYKVETNRFWDNCFVTVGAGAQIYLGDHNHQCKFGDRISPALDVAVGKWFTPGIGARLAYSGLTAKGATQNNSYSTGEGVPGKDGHGYWLMQQKYNVSNLHMDVLFNLSNLFCGYNERRVWNVSTYLGLGWGHSWEGSKENDVTGNFGVLNTWRLCKSLDLNLDVRGMIVNDDFDGEVGGSRGEGMVSATLGLTYKFKQRGWDRSKTVVRYNNEAIDELRRRMNELSEENAGLKKALADAEQRPTEAPVTRVASANLITFKIGKSTLSNEARANLGMFAEVVKTSDPQAVYTITGYADKGTGSKQLNERLSKARAEAVYKCLTEEFGVNSEQLRIDYKGGVDNMFYDDPRLSRAVITRAQ